MSFRLMLEKLYISRPSILFGNFILYLRVKLGKTLLKKLWDFGHQTPIALSLPPLPLLARLPNRDRIVCVRGF